MNKGYVIILGGYISWGLFPLYWAMLRQVPAIEVLLHRIKLTRRLGMSHSANACLFAARHQNAALVILKQVLITPSASTHALAYHIKLKELGATDKRQPGVAALANGTTISGELRLDQALISSPECDILGCRVNIRRFDQRWRLAKYTMLPPSLLLTRQTHHGD